MAGHIRGKKNLLKEEIQVSILKTEKQKSVFRIRIRPDPKLFGLKDPAPDPKLLFLIRIRILLRIRILPFFTPNLKICFKNVLKS